MDVNAASHITFHCPNVSPDAFPSNTKGARVPRAPQDSLVPKGRYLLFSQTTTTPHHSASARDESSSGTTVGV